MLCWTLPTPSLSLPSRAQSQKEVVNKKKKSKKQDDSDDEVRFWPRTSDTRQHSARANCAPAPLLPACCSHAPARVPPWQDTIAQKKKLQADKAAVKAAQDKIKGKK